MSKTSVVITGVVIVVLGLLVYSTYHFSHIQAPGSGSSTSTTMEKMVTFSCERGKSITATFYVSQDDHVQLVLSDGRTVNVPHAISANGARYANSDESFVFWNVGNTAFITEGVGPQSSTTYSNCMQQGSASVNLPLPNVTYSGTTATWTDPSYGFSITYPADLSASTTFAGYYHLPAYWRADTGPDSTGTPIISIPVYRLNNAPNGVATGAAYPLYFDAEVRVGVSRDPLQVNTCLHNDPGYASETSKNVTFSDGTIWKKFSFSSAGMMQYLNALSYRTVHNGTCYVVEALETGSSYRDDTMATGTPDETLHMYFVEAQNIAESVRFTQ